MKQINEHSSCTVHLYSVKIKYTVAKIFTVNYSRRFHIYTYIYIHFQDVSTVYNWYTKYNPDLTLRHKCGMQYPLWSYGQNVAVQQAHGQSAIRVLK